MANRVTVLSRSMEEEEEEASMGWASFALLVARKQLEAKAQLLVMETVVKARNIKAALRQQERLQATRMEEEEAAGFGEVHQAQIPEAAQEEVAVALVTLVDAWSRLLPSPHLATQALHQVKPTRITWPTLRMRLVWLEEACLACQRPLLSVAMAATVSL